jgi:hypothetical protein
MSVILDFETETGWSLNAQAHIEADATAPTQPNRLRMVFGGFNPSAFITLSDLTLGHQYRVFAWCNFDGVDESEASNINVTIQYADQPAYFNAVLYKDITVSGWELRDIGILTYGEVGFPTTADLPLRLVGHQSFNPGTVLIDAIYIGVIPFQAGADMARKWSAIAAAISAIKGINGSGDNYNVDFENRVYSRLFLPTEQPTVKLPYACVPLNQEGETIAYEGFAFTSTYRVIGYAFFTDNPESDVLETNGGFTAATFRDDLIRVFMSDQTLGGQAQNVEVTAIETYSGSDGDPTTWVIFTIDFLQIAGAADLEPV